MRVVKGLVWEPSRLGKVRVRVDFDVGYREAGRCAEFALRGLVERSARGRHIWRCRRIPLPIAKMFRLEPEIAAARIHQLQENLPGGAPGEAGRVPRRGV